MKTIADIWKNYNLSIILVSLFVLCWILQTWTGWVEFRAEQQTRHEPAQWLGDSGYIWGWLRSTMENWQSEFLQLSAFVILTAYFIHKGSHESKDTDDEMMEILKNIERRLKALEHTREKV